MEFEKIAELAGDIMISEEMKQTILRNCKREYLRQQEKNSSVARMVSEYLNEKHQANSI